MSLTGLLIGQDVRVRRDVKDLGFLYLSVASAFVLICVALLFLWCRMTVVNTGYEISKANTARAGLIDRNKRLRLEFMKLKSPERIEKIASSELGLVHPTGGQIVNIR
ncbi:MAG: hypothetical protein ACE5GY_00615 [Thermodesulfobacteriota bacterium]